jgi:hypothetical protein
MTPHAPSMRCHGNRMQIEIFEFLREFEYICENALGARDGCLIEKTEGRKSRDTVLLMTSIHTIEDCQTIANFIIQ